MAEETPPVEHEVDAVTAEEIATGMTDEQLRDAWGAATDRDNPTDLESAILSEMGRRKIDP